MVLGPARNPALAGLVYLFVTRRRTLLFCLASASALLAASAPAAAAGPSSSDVVPIVLLRRSAMKPPTGGADVLVPADLATDEIARRADALLSAPAGFGQHVLRLNRFVRTYLLHDLSLTPGRRRALSQPAYLFLSDRQGGYPASSFWLEQPSGHLTEMRDVAFVDTVVLARDLSPGRIDGVVEIYAHELGHLMMAALAGPAPRRASTAMHFMTTRTDAWYAFTEGFGEHFQPLGLDAQRDAAVQAARGKGAPESERTWYGRFVREQVEGCIVCPANLRFLHWQGAREQRLRDLPLRSNQFIYRVSLPERLDRRSSFEGRLYRDLAVPTQNEVLSNGVQMMESEAVIAALFYRLATDSRLASTYREPAFYEPFLDDRQVAALRESGPAAVVSPSENVYLKLFDVMHRSFAWGDWPAIELIAGYARRFPDEAAAVYDVYLDVTRGVTVDREAPIRNREAGYLAQLRDRLMAGPANLDSNLGPALWMSVPSTTFALGVFRYFPVPSSFTFDLNAADVPDLRAVPGVTAEVAKAIIEARDVRGSFSSVNDLAAAPGFPLALMPTFQSMAATMETRLKTTEPQQEDSAFFKNLMVPLLLGSYYVAAVWQFGVALLLAGLAFAVARWASMVVLQVPSEASPAGPRGWRLWRRRAARSLGRGVACAAVPCVVSVALYAAGVLPTAANMTLVGVGLGATFAGGRVALRRPAAATVPVLVPGILAIAAASLVIGMMY